MSVDEKNKDVELDFLKHQYTQKALMEKTKYPDNLEMSEIESFGRQRPDEEGDIEQ
jgi:hypothetical protein